MKLFWIFTFIVGVRRVRATSKSPSRAVLPSKSKNEKSPSGDEDPSNDIASNSKELMTTNVSAGVVNILDSIAGTIEILGVLLLVLEDLPMVSFNVYLIITSSEIGVAILVSVLFSTLMIGFKLRGITMYLQKGSSRSATDVAA